MDFLEIFSRWAENGDRAREDRGKGSEKQASQGIGRNTMIQDGLENATVSSGLGEGFGKAFDWPAGASLKASAWPRSSG